MIERGKREGWLSLPPQTLPSWATLNGVEFNGVRIGRVAGAEHKGLALIATERHTSEDTKSLMVIPPDLILSKETVHAQARVDKHLRDVLQAMGDFSQTSRGAILISLLMYATHACPDNPESIGVSSANADYVKYLPLERLPTFWGEDELALLQGTSLYPAVTAKLNSLRREFEALQESTSSIAWCQTCWWGADQLTFDDWKQVDAMYRSRALEFPGIGDAMVPCIDMANHAANEQTVARYETDAEGNGLMLLLDDKTMGPDTEVTITYGDEKGACEMLFSYGFLEQQDDDQDARDVFLDLEIPDDDPLKRPKQVVAGCAPGVRIKSREGKIEWHGEYVWTLCVNEEDGLDFELAQTTDGGRELAVTWKGKRIESMSNMSTILAQEPLWDVFSLRASVCIQSRVQSQLETLQETRELAERSDSTYSVSHIQALKLREAEGRLLEKTFEFLESEKERLAQTAAVRSFLEGMAAQANASDEDDEENDFL